jgi:phosphoribosylformylglycinamidine synthase
MSMDFVHDGIPMPTRRAKVVESKPGPRVVATAPATIERLLTALAHPNVASKHWIIRQYDHEVQGGSVIKPLVGPMQLGPADASVIRPKLGSNKGVVVSCGLRPDIEDAYQMALSAIDEAIRNAVCVGAKLDTLAILDNFCWPGVHDEDSMGTLVRACEGCRDGSLGYGIPFISGKDSLHNQFTDADSGRVIRIPRTLLISAIGVIDDVSKCVTSNFKSGSNHVYRIVPAREEASLVDRRATHEVVSNLIAAGAILSCHDVSDGGTLVAVAEMCIGSGLGVTMRPGPQLEKAGLFSQYDTGYIVEVATSKLPEFNRTLERHPNVRGESIGQTMQNPRLILWESKRAAIEWPVEELLRAWRGTLDW